MNEIFNYYHFHHTSTLPLRVSVTMLVDYLTRTLKNTKITLNYQQLSNEFGDNNWLVPKKKKQVARWTAYVAVTWKRKE